MGKQNNAATQQEKAMQGVIKKLLSAKRCGFITGRDKKDYFFHQSALKNCKFEELGEGQEVEFEDEEAEKGPRAADIYV